VIEEEIRPAVAMDGGRHHFRRLREGDCQSAPAGRVQRLPSSIMTLKMGIERRLKEEFPEIVSVEAV